MNGLGDSLTIGILLTLIFGAVSFYLYSRLTQNEKRVSLLENLLLTLKVSTEASLGGPDSVEPVSSPAPLQHEDVDVEEESYADLLTAIPTPSVAPLAPLAPLAPVAEEDEAEDAQSEASASSKPSSPLEQVQPAGQVRQVDVNYEAMSVKELSALAKQRGITGVPQRKAELIGALRKQGGGIPLAPTPLDQDDELGGAKIESGFEVAL